MEQTFLNKVIAWQNAAPIPGRDETEWRHDAFGSVIKWSDYGDRNSEYGWEIDHQTPTALGGSDSANNLRALHWRNNASLGGMLASALSRATR